MNTVLITGCSSGYGLETARYFHAEGWNVIATMRTPRADLLPHSDRMRVLALDVTRADSIAKALDDAGPIDVLVNNAGIGVVGVFEATPFATIREVFETNTFGVMATTQAVVPRFRDRRADFNVRVKLVEPGYCPTTRFTENGAPRLEGLITEPYTEFARPIFEEFAKVSLTTRESDVAEAVWRAANDVSETLRYPAGPDAVALAAA